MSLLDPASRAFLDRQRLAHLATADVRGAPQVVPICFALVGETVYVAIDEKPKSGDFRRLRRLRNIADNAQVSIVVDVYDDADWSALGFVLLGARARIIDGGQEHARAIAALRGRYAQYRAMQLEGRPVIAADVERVTRWGRLDA